TEGDAATFVDPNLTVADVDDSTLAGANVTALSFDAADVLSFTPGLGITGSYNAGTGVLTLTGTASPASYQSILRSVTFRNTGDDPGTSRTIRFTANDGDVD